MGVRSGLDTKETDVCSLAAVSVTGEFTLFPLRDVPLNMIYVSRVAWTDNQHVRLSFASPGNAVPPKIFRVP